MANKKTFDVDGAIRKDDLAVKISERYQEWNMFRATWMTQTQEVRDYLFATDTRTTTNNKNNWKNSTTVPKLCQIRDNLHANYLATLFPNSYWLDWEGASEDEEDKDKRNVIEQYMLSKTRQSGFRSTVSDLLGDYIDYGNCFATIDYVEERIKDPNTGEETFGYVGPKLRRLSPLDVVFDPTANSFEETPVIVRSTMSMGSILKTIKEQPDKAYLQEAVEEFKAERQMIANSLAQGDQLKSTGYQHDGFGGLHNYYKGDIVEVLDFYGDIYDSDSGEPLFNYHITVVDHNKVIRMEANPSWIGRHPIYHTGWRKRPDNLYGMGPLDNIVGMQYRIDHLENLKADVFDLIASPMFKIRGDVDEFVFGPGARIILGDEADVEMWSPDSAALQANFEIAELERRMEEMAGAPKMAMGIRTPGEKTAYEVQTLDNASSRIFQNKVAHFESTFMEKVINGMFEVGRRNLVGSDVVRVFKNDDKVVDFLNITKEDLSSNGKFRPVGARHFAEQAQMLQNISNFYNSAVANDEQVKVHFSGLQVAKMVEQLLNLEPYNLVQENIRIQEAAQTQRLANTAQEDVAVEQATPSGVTQDDIGEPDY